MSFCAARRASQTTAPRTHGTCTPCRYKSNMLSLNAFSVTYSTVDEIVVPRESETWGFYAPGQSKTVTPFNETDAYQVRSRCDRHARAPRSRPHARNAAGRLVGPEDAGSGGQAVVPPHVVQARGHPQGFVQGHLHAVHQATAGGLTMSAGAPPTARKRLLLRAAPAFGVWRRQSTLLQLTLVSSMGYAGRR